MREVARTPKAEIIYEKEKAVKGGFSGPIEIVYTSFLVQVGRKGCCLEVPMGKNEMIIKE